MATGDLDYIRAVGAEMLSQPSFASCTTTVQNEIDAIANESYRECFLRPNGKRTRWGERRLDFLLPAEVSFTFTATAGARSIGTPSTAPVAAYAGSKILIGTKYYTYAGAVGSDHFLTEPWEGTTGVVNATIYHSSYVLPLQTLEVSDEPTVLGKGTLIPLIGEGQENRIRSRIYGDFDGEEHPVWGDFPTLAEEVHTGDPYHYYVDDYDLAPNETQSASPRLRFRVYPLPSGTARAITMRAAMVPALMTTGADLPFMKAEAIIDILLPIFRMKLALTNRRYAGGNLDGLVMQGRSAERKLTALDTSQRRKMRKIKTKGGW